MNTLEQQLDAEFKKRNVPSLIYHFVCDNCDIYPYKAITIATTRYWIWESLLGEIEHHINASYFSKYGRTTELKWQLERAHLYPAICNSRDQFNRQRGRIIAKGRLLKHLKEEHSKEGLK